MDYKTKGTSRHDLRYYSQILRKVFGVPQTSPFPVLEALDKISDVFSDCGYEVVSDDKFSLQTLARCVPNSQGGFTIEIKETVYNGAYEKKIGAFLGFICHEICHVFLFKIGFVPIFERSFANNELPAYCSIEWQAKALCGEVMIPFEESKGMSVSAIRNKYHVSMAFAKKRKEL